jgi:AraC-like DNA-binding protein
MLQTAERERVREPQAFRRRMASLFSVDFAVEPTDEQPFDADMVSYKPGRLRMARIAFSAHTTSRLPLPAADGREHFLVGHQQKGEITVRQDGREAAIRPGDIYVLNASRDFHIRTTDILTHSVYVPALHFRAAFPEIDCCTAMAFPTPDGPARVVGTMLSNLFDIAPVLDDESGDRFADALPHVVAIALGAKLVGAVSQSRLGLYQKERVKSFVRRNLREPDLDCDRIAKAVKLSPRYIYDLFADEPLTLMRWVWAERLAMCRRELSLPALRGRSIGEIAFSWGFVDLAHFSRSFRNAYGVSPRSYRNRTLLAAATGGPKRESLSN